MVADLAERLCCNIEKVIIGKRMEIKLCLIALLAKGHILLEDVPGTGKTVLGKALSQSLGGVFTRIQFTPDLLPTELVGLNIYHPHTGEFSFKKGSLFANIVLADEINRATPRTQSGLLESMEENTVSVDGTTHILPHPYFVIATQNPVETGGTFPLPEAQLDRFMIRLSLGYPNRDDSEGIIHRFVEGKEKPQIDAVCSSDEFAYASTEVKKVRLHDDVVSYIVSLAEATRLNKFIQLGLSTRGMLALTSAAQAKAAVDGRNYVIPEDVKYLIPYVIPHRIIFRNRESIGTETAADVLRNCVESVTVPTEKWE